MMDPLYYGVKELKSDELVEFRSGEKVIKGLEQMVKDGRNLDQVLNCSPEVIEHFNEIFPEVVYTNETGAFDTSMLKSWKKRGILALLFLEFSPRKKNLLYNTYGNNMADKS